ncbi:hypothetical protein L2E82_51289 [Cichorium intybus]|nr:hypothetical protein L2E82_51289 [Cichorium intybus]
MDPNILNDYHEFLLLEASCNDSAIVYLTQLWKLVYNSDQQTRYSKPMPWMGMYTALASLFSVFAMVADLLHGMRNSKLRFPCRYFTLNAASLTVIAIAIKLPMDLSNLMPDYVDQAAKLGSLGFMCTMMANLLPSLATMNSKELFSNMIALGVLVITLVVDICIQINTGILTYHATDGAEEAYVRDQRFIAITYVALLLMLLMIYACSSLSIVKSKEILESKYQAVHETDLKDREMQQQLRLGVVWELRQRVHNYWTMAGTGSPQFMTACSVTTSASGVICVLSTILHSYIMPFHIETSSSWDYNSDYKWSMLVILMTQFVGVIVGAIAPLSRYYTYKSFKISSIWNHIKVSTVESYWTQKLSDWKHSSMSFESSSCKCKIVIQNLKILILNLCIGFQMIVVMVCKMMVVLWFFLPICVQSCFFYWKRLKTGSSSINSAQNDEPVEQNKDRRRYVLQLQDDKEFAERTLRSISKSVDHLIQKAERKEPENLVKLLAKSRPGFEGVEKFDSPHVPPLLSEEYLHCWSLPLVTLTIVAVSLPNIQKNLLDCLLSGVREGLVYVSLVEETLNAFDDHVGIQKAAKTLWLEVEANRKWLGNKLPKLAPQVNTAGRILQWLSNTAERNYLRCDNSEYMSISANSMYRITKTIMLSYDEKIDTFSQVELFTELSSLIADILGACLNNLPQVIIMKCHTSAIEKREASVHAAAQLLGETTQIISSLQVLGPPRLNPEELAFIDKWRAYFMHHFP